MKLAYFNKLPAKAEYIQAVLNVLTGKELPLNQIQKKTGLTKTQVACSLEQLIAENQIEIICNKNKNYYKKLSL